MRGKKMFKVVMIILVVIVGMGWIAYGIWRCIETRRERSRPEKKSPKLDSVRKSYDDYIEKLEKFKKPEKPDSQKDGG